MDDVAPAPPPPPGSSYEFEPAEDAVIERTARWVTWWGWIAVAAGILLIVGGLTTWDEGGLAQAALGGVYILIGVYFRGAGRALARVVDTTGNDIGHLMEALDRLTAAFRVQVILVVVFVVMAVVAITIIATRGGTTVP
ncbi:MAG: hypothetical protein KY453_10125 [Gemmatimonadetes bacterium]|nr:hypothetical protein [Gemmatimonadota bacterium]